VPSVRLVLPEFNSLSLASVVVTKNLPPAERREICVFGAKDQNFVAKTLTVQDSRLRRAITSAPVRDEKQGMIPPQVAQIMLNLGRL